jgi:predicted DCC family thiol-disulfide oxidoreductase YuxK
MREIILFDGECMMCNYWMHYILDRDQQDRFLFAALQSNYGQSFLAQQGLPQQDFTSLYLVDESTAHYHKSTAIIKILSRLSPLYFWVNLAWLCPRFLRDMAYDFIAKHRLKFKKQHCRILSENNKKKILD